MMDSVRQTLLSLCTACVLGAVIQGILPERAQKPGINMVLLLYILSTALHFSRELSFPEFWKTANARISEYSYEEYADGLYRVEIERELRTALALSQPMASLRLTEEAVCLVKGVSLTEAEQLLRAAGWQGEIREELP